MPPSASIILQMKNDGKLSPNEIQGVVNLVSMAVEGLQPKHITVTDMKGRPLYTPEDDTAGLAMSNTQLEYKAEIENKIQRRIMELLGPVVGPGKVVARVNTDLDFSQKTIRKEVYDPDGAVVRSETRNEEATQAQPISQAANLMPTSAATVLPVPVPRPIPRVNPGPPTMKSISRKKISLPR